MKIGTKVEACSVLVLSLDANAANATAGGAAAAPVAAPGAAPVSEAAQEETARMSARIEVLETAFANRGLQGCPLPEI